MSQIRFTPHPGDFVIPVMGLVGSGRTNFIDNLTGNAEQRKAGGLKTDTQSVTPYPISYQSRRFVLVDTPGFDHTRCEDSMILREIADWLTEKYQDGMTLKIAGIIYVHRITDNRISGSAYKNLQMFSRLCGNIPLVRMRLVTTMWDLAKDQAAVAQREAKLKDEFWRALLKGGATAHRFHNAPGSAQEIVGGLLSIGNCNLLLQEERVKQQKRLDETEAGHRLGVFFCGCLD